MRVRLNRARMADAEGVGSPPIGDGQAISTSIPDTMDGIKFEVDKAKDYVSHYRGDPLIVDVVEKIAHACPSKNKVCLANAIFEWAKANFLFVNDPWGGEKLKTGRRMIRDLATPREILAAILAPLLGKKIKDGTLPAVIVSHKFPANAEEFERIVHDPKWVPKSKIVEDCDGAATFAATLLAAAGLRPRFILGGRPDGNGRCEWHHIWVEAQVEEGQWIALDVSEPISTFGWSFPFKCADIVEIFKG